MASLSRFYSFFYILMKIGKNQNQDVYQRLIKSMTTETIDFLQEKLSSISIVKLVGGNNSQEGIVYVKGRDAALFVNCESINIFLRSIYFF